ncbi:hypothetical protein KKB28_03255 [bacterium]|nr:hypothetical protein [bacterium]
MSTKQKTTGKQKIQSLALWILALVITLSIAVYQRKTGPTYPIDGEAQLSGAPVSYVFLRSHGGEGGALVEVVVEDGETEGVLVWRRYPTKENWTEVRMHRELNKLVSEIPHQPPAGKVEYYVNLERGDAKLMLPADRAVVLRYKGAVPAGVLVPHILLMFMAMLFAARAGLEALRKGANTRFYVAGAAGLTLVGGMILGPVVQNYAFGAFWTGVPFGWDLTDNKTLIAMVGWVIAFIATRRNPPARIWVLGASLLMFVIFMIPHSTLGSQLDYSTLSEP